jgi:hypothetical protein
MTADQRHHRRGTDQGSILPIVLVATVVFTMIVGGVATLTTTGLRYGQVVEQRADLLAAADGGLRYGIERLRNMEDLCSTGVGDGGYTTIFPPQINGADTSVTCTRVGDDIADIQGWGAVITGSNVPSGQKLFTVKGSGTSTVQEKTFRGPVYLADPAAAARDLQATLIIEDGDLWYTSGGCEPGPGISDPNLFFDPSFLRGPTCSTRTWDQLFKAPTKRVPTASALSVPAPYDDISFTSCRVFSPGKYTGSIPLAGDNYFKSGDYYFEDVEFDVFNQSAVFGFPSGSGDVQRISVGQGCHDALDYDRANSGERGGGTLWLGGDSTIVVDTGGELEIFRRQQNEVYLSVVVVDSNGVGFRSNDNSFKAAPSIDWILETKSGNTNDAAFHGLIWAPHSKISLGNVTNAAIGQIIGGLAVGQLDVQASASTEEFAIGVEGTPIETHFLLESTSVKGGDSTTIRAVVQFRPDGRELAINSWRIVD